MVVETDGGTKRIKKGEWAEATVEDLDWTTKMTKTMTTIVGSFTVAIFELIFGFIFGSFSVFGREISKMR